MDRHFWTQSVKTALAAVLAWLVAAQLLRLPHPFLAPYAAFFVVNDTVYRSFANGAQQLASLLTGLVLAWVTAELVPWPLAGLGLVVLAGLALGRLRVFGDNGQWVAVTALLVLTYGQATEQQTLAMRAVESGLGVVVGVAVNFLVLPPVHLRGARRAVAALAADLGTLVREMADQPEPSGRAREWARRADDLRERANAAHRANGRAEESARFTRWRACSPERGAALRALARVAEEVRHQADTLRDQPGEAAVRYRALLPGLAEAVEAIGEGREVSPPSVPEERSPLLLSLRHAVAACRMPGR
ncbi:uncharacterized membrane protein YgaE (UPF0421/DUF939 family) [Crossiella equi]|uniref:Uncharacterized membrane protein YgaE (UPF0421/DUF939 family) n=1 Tax=Crossiella equi TaxID=130796 RepID=A0ABS5A7Q0_9PSEU|nr:FUSC family protein [Crossiella equi]MBP2472620.1 uncharacterized membrane protein YgaE (UPF0421/DUF939 family) [Crossiella equi]